MESKNIGQRIVNTEYDIKESMRKFANTKEHRYGSPETNKNNMLAKGCMIPLFNENNMPIDAKGWVKPLKKYLLNDLKIPGVCVYPVGLGKVEIFLSGVPCDQQ